MEGLFYIPVSKNFFGFVVSVRLRQQSLISDFITGTVEIKTFLFILVNPYEMVTVFSLYTLFYKSIHE